MVRKVYLLFPHVNPYFKHEATPDTVLFHHRWAVPIVAETSPSGSGMPILRIDLALVARPCRNIGILDYNGMGESATPAMVIHCVPNIS
jgi:hypothetical protein